MNYLAPEKVGVGGGGGWRWIHGILTEGVYVAKSATPPGMSGKDVNP